MSTIPQVMPPPSVTSYPPLYRLSVEQYHQLEQAGILGENDNVELLEGLLVEKMTKGAPHDGCLTTLGRRLMRALPEDKSVRLQCAITLSDSEPEPDVAVAEGSDECYMSRHPRPRDLHLVGEVADTSLLLDRTHKMRVYARARIPVYWIVNLQENVIEVYTQPRAGRNPTYLHRQNYGLDHELPVLIDGREAARLAVRDLLP